MFIFLPAIPSDFCEDGYDENNYIQYSRINKRFLSAELIGRGALKTPL
jgi:hypothetical protein